MWGPLPERTGSKNILADAEALLGEIAEQLHKVSDAEISKHDSNHMVLGSYVKHTTYTKGIWKRIAPYIDALGPQDLSDVNPIKPSVEATGVPAMLSDQEFGNVYPLALQGKTGAPGAVPDHVDRRVLYDLLAARIARDPDFIGVSYCAVLYDQSHWRRRWRWPPKVVEAICTMRGSSSAAGSVIQAACTHSLSARSATDPTHSAGPGPRGGHRPPASPSSRHTGSGPPGGSSRARRTAGPLPAHRPARPSRSWCRGR